MNKITHIRIVDLFAGMGGIRLGLQNACDELGFTSECVFASEIKPYAIKALNQNFSSDEYDNLHGDITKVNPKDIPDFDVLCAGFPCQPFSYAGKRLGFVDDRGEMFFYILRILREKAPYGFILENVEGLTTHDKGRTLETILRLLREELQYNVSYKILNASDFGIPQNRKRIFIVGTKNGFRTPNLESFTKMECRLSDVLEEGLDAPKCDLSELLLKHFNIEQLYGKSIKDKRGGDNNIHSWDIELKGKIPQHYKQFLNKLMTERRQKKWAEQIGIDWMDGMTLNLSQIKEFWHSDDTEDMLNRLVELGYLSYEHPKKKVIKEDGSSYRTYDTTKEKGYNIVSGKLSFAISTILDPNGICPTLVATDVSKLYVVDSGKLRPLTIRECLRLNGYPETYTMDGIKQKECYDLLGNTVVVPVVKQVALRLLNAIN